MELKKLYPQSLVLVSQIGLNEWWLVMLHYLSTLLPDYLHLELWVSTADNLNSILCQSFIKYPFPVYLMIESFIYSSNNKHWSCTLNHSKNKIFQYSWETGSWRKSYNHHTVKETLLHEKKLKIQLKKEKEVGHEWKTLWEGRGGYPDTKRPNIPRAEYFTMMHLRKYKK